MGLWLPQDAIIRGVSKDGVLLTFTVKQAGKRVVVSGAACPAIIVNMIPFKTARLE